MVALGAALRAHRGIRRAGAGKTLEIRRRIAPIPAAPLMTPRI